MKLAGELQSITADLGFRRYEETEKRNGISLRHKTWPTGQKGAPGLDAAPFRHGSERPHRGFRSDRRRKRLLPRRVQARSLRYGAMCRHPSKAGAYMPVEHFPPAGYLLPTCPSCGESMMLSRIDPESSDHDRRTFECFPCNRSESVVVRYRAEKRGAALKK
jgi:hypothetical protein